MINKVGFFFDLDGTLIDNINVMVESYFSFMSEYNQKGTKEEFDQYNGVPINVFLKDFIVKNSLDESVSSMWGKYEKLLLENYKVIKPRDGVVDVFKLLKSKGIPFAIVTSATRNIATCWSTSQLDHNLTPLIITCDDVEKTKPSPEPYLKAMQLLDCRNGFAVEDSLNGVVSANKAGLKTFQFQDQASSIVIKEVFKTIKSFKQLEQFIESL